MDYRQSFSVSAVGMSIERARVDVAALNLANANTAQSADGNGFRPMRVVARSLMAPTAFSTLMNESLATGQGVNAAPQFSMEPINASPRLVYEPGHPMANEKGFVAYPGVDTATETVTMMSAMRAYEANVAALNTSKTMALKALDIGGGN
ncbi:flagellar basal body rod protein FlgC [Undibacterium flavidum]|uniref:Flagellar basal-body rod protein FlgC n=1 Tax=Undibacterium flavidum TaxID=2762297 RepID=A0ABR6YET1_9BURK|nr:flagellar basal body rod protein FlgC [Undibacterium flavidum]MBC3875063.1 flagellar basal body rod protein FlgC [Undibacterium flavidum]